MNLSPKDYIELGIFFSTVLIVVLDRFALVKRHQEMIEKHDMILGKLDSSIINLQLALSSLTAEFKTYREMAPVSFHPVKGQQEYLGGYRNQ